jgi:hypothetical protein
LGGGVQPAQAAQPVAADLSRRSHCEGGGQAETPRPNSPPPAPRRLRGLPLRPCQIPRNSSQCGGMSNIAPGPRARELAFVWTFAVLQCLLTMLLSAWLLFRPSLLAIYYPRLVSQQQSQDAVAITQWLTQDRPATDLNPSLHHGSLQPKEIKHFEDVRHRLQQGLPVLLGTFVLLAAVLVLFRPSLHWLAQAQTRCAILAMIVSCFAIILACWDWRAFFAFVHQPLFGPTSWRMPSRAYSLQLFPPRFWQIMGMVLAFAPVVLSLVIFGLLSKAKRQSVPR